ncbi:MAG TPA: LLM class flavin-dependent oxidoreductase [Alphaproteobacteria bacterium]|jgi:alkanesulfonate monooxygenase SsuD/methylene tetrahydromethanopterin reductase-like flavin-dependent oxidoreductase (luciferase family)|nr:LLM class flavin-dependent oxidoreductase [Alphaproteobacteria bacterium]
MKFSIIYEAQMVDTSRANEAQVFSDMIDQCKLADELGFDVIWSVEHHCLTQYAHLSAPESFLAFVAGATKRIHVGHGVVCLPFKMNHPIKVAERVATLDLLSKGRLHFGVGKGGTIQETGAFDTRLEDVTPQVDESMYLIPKMWMQETIEHHGLIDIPERPIHPKPYQDPHPPMYMACTREEALEIAGSRGLGALVLGFSGPDEIAKKNAIYRKAWKNRKAEDQVGYRPTEHLAALCPAIILDDAAKAKRIGTRGQRFFAESIRYWYAGGEKPSVDDLDADVQMAAMEQSKEQIVAYLGQEKIPVTDASISNYHIEEDAYGSVEQAIRYVERLEAAGADEILFLVQMGTVPHEATMETIRNIGEHLIPHFKAKYAAAAE